jgi:hypothetical protein
MCISLRGVSLCIGLTANKWNHQKQCLQPASQLPPPPPKNSLREENCAPLSFLVRQGTAGTQPGKAEEQEQQFLSYCAQVVIRNTHRAQLPAGQKGYGLSATVLGLVRETFTRLTQSHTKKTPSYTHHCIIANYTAHSFLCFQCLQIPQQTSITPFRQEK